ncbi:MAG: class I SAM-dependent methyltransferase, partial [Chitinophagaceae bacterium]
IYSSNTIIQYKRERVRAQIRGFLKPNSDILELNAGTGEDGIFFARLGHHIHETDVSTGMLHILSQKINQQHFEGKITVENCSFTNLHKLKNKGPYDLIFSNFAGINCTNEIYPILGYLPELLKPDGKITLVFLPSFCLWEFLMMFKGKFKTAFRRFCGKKGAKAHIEGIYFRCWYFRPSKIIKRLRRRFDLIGYEGLCTLVPPSYIEHFPEKYPQLYAALKRREDSWKSKWPCRFIGDYVILSFRKRI